MIFSILCFLFFNLALSLHVAFSSKECKKSLIRGAAMTFFFFGFPGLRLAFTALTVPCHVMSRGELRGIMINFPSVVTPNAKYENYFATSTKIRQDNPSNISSFFFFLFIPKNNLISVYYSIKGKEYSDCYSDSY